MPSRERLLLRRSQYGKRDSGTRLLLNAAAAEA
jgi:hypothetical protein